MGALFKQETNFVKIINQSLHDIKRNFAYCLFSVDEESLRKVSEMTCYLDEVHLKLESDKPDWEDLGKDLGIDPCKLQEMKTTSSVNPAKEVLEIAHCQNAGPMTIGDLKRILRKIKREDVCDVLAVSPSAPFAGEYKVSLYSNKSK